MSLKADLSICLTKLVIDMYMINGYLKKQGLGYPEMYSTYIYEKDEN
jgi:hypothetical protein